MRALLPLAVLAPLAASLSAATIVVDDDGGPGVDFTDIQAALDAAAPGDVVLVHPGFYAGYTLTKGVTLLGSAGAPVVGGAVEIRDVPAGGVALVSNLEHKFSTTVENCGGTVILDRLHLSTTTALDVGSSADVRAHDLVVSGATTVTNSRFEATGGLFRGYDGTDSTFCTLGIVAHGQTALTARPGAIVHLSLCNLDGGDGGGTGLFCPTSALGGDGGAGLRVGPGAQVLAVGGGSSIFSGGKAGIAFDCPYDGQPGSAVLVAAGGVFSYSNVGFLPATNPLCATSGEAILDEGGVVSDLGIGLATLKATGATPAGSTSTFTIQGAVASTALLGFGATPTLLPFPGSTVGILTSLDLALLSGAIPGSGQLDVPVAVPPTIPVGAMAVVQAAVLPSSGPVQLTSSLPWIVVP